jgi:Carboxypeptidase regulatory-like domain
LTQGFLLRLSVGIVLGFCAGLMQPQTPAAAKREVKTNSSAGRYEITGVVISSVGGDPVAHCHLTPNLAGRRGFGNRQFPAPTSGFECDARGHFRVTLPSAGSWQLTASAPGFVSQAFDEHELYSSAIVLTEDAPTKDIVFRLSPEASIVGLVLDEAGEPVRNAQIMLQTVPPPSPGGPEPVGTMRGNARTDDRGMYEIANLAPGGYRLTVHAQPWYAANLQQIRGTADTPSPDPSLDVAYPATWFPGVSDPALAETIVLHAGDTRQADFHLVPIASIHLKILTPPRVSSGPNTVGSAVFPIVQQMNSAGGGPNFVQATTRMDAQGQLDVGGLTPGMYQIRLSGPNQEGHAAVVEVTANSARTLDLSTTPHDMARITLRLDGLGDADANSRPGRNGGVQVTLIDRDTHRGSFTFNGNEWGGGNLLRRDQRDAAVDRVLEIPPGRYEVVLQGQQNIFLTGLSAKGAETTGRYVAVGAGESTLTVHMASGRANLSGIATLEGKPLAGAVVLLVPVTIEDPNSITFLERDQTNTDGSFELANIIPGQYILVAIDHGWQINWGDPSTLRRYLMQGVPVELKSSAIVKQNIVAEAP